MAQGMQALRRRIRSTENTMKITSAMELLANSKLMKIRNDMEKNKEYASVLRSTLQQVMSKGRSLDSPYLRTKDSKKALSIVFSSDLGLCGGYNSSMFRYAMEMIDKEDPIMVVGSKLRNWLSARDYDVVNEYINSDEISYAHVSRLISDALDMYLKDEIGRIQIIYTRFVNSLTSEPAHINLLPMELREKKEEAWSQDTIFEPGAEEILGSLVPMALKSTLYSCWLETKTSEQSSRRASMESATDNGQELKEKLILEYNRARQASITQEITEIVGGAEAL